MPATSTDPSVLHVNRGDHEQHTDENEHTQQRRPDPFDVVGAVLRVITPGQQQGRGE